MIARLYAAACVTTMALAVRRILHARRHLAAALNLDGDPDDQPCWGLCPCWIGPADESALCDSHTVSSVGVSACDRDFGHTGWHSDGATRWATRLDRPAPGVYGPGQGAA